jgi:hypothetical protein
MRTGDNMIFSGVLCVRHSSWSFKNSCKSPKYSYVTFLAVHHSSWWVGVPVGVRHSAREGLVLRGCRKNEAALCSYIRSPRGGPPLPTRSVRRNDKAGVEVSGVWQTARPARKNASAPVQPRPDL